MRRVARAFGTWVCAFGMAIGVGACFDDPVSSEGDECALGEEGCSCLPNATCFGELSCVQGVCLDQTGETGGDGDGDSGDGDGDSGDGDGDPEENVVVDLFAEACGVTTSWTTVNTLDVELPIVCDQEGEDLTGWMVRYPTLTIGDDSFEKVIGIVAPAELGAQVRGLYNLDDVPGVLDLEFRADVLLRCADADPDCGGKFALAIAEGVPMGIFAEADDRQLTNLSAPVPISFSLSVLATLSEPSIALLAERTDDLPEPTPEVLIVSPRLVLP